MITIILLLLFAYFLGSIPTGVVLAKAVAGADPRQAGSGNIGATNVYRTVGKKLGILTLLGDIVKGLLPVIAAKWALDSSFWVAAVALTAFIGHLFPVFLNFRGGKGIATGLGVFLALSPIPALLAFLIFAVVVSRWRFISLGSLCATAAFPLFLAWLDPHRLYIPFAIVIGALIFYRHRENISRLISGKESKFGAKAKPSSPHASSP
jgi:acyl phosphate:glycerol-3-phosphate acyltransferase